MPFLSTTSSGDSETVWGVFAKGLAADGYTVVCAADGQEGFDIFKTDQAFDKVPMDF
jgi:CheY-like chemotaxis protein